MTFGTAMRPTNPGVRLEIGNTGPVSRFVAAAVPLISGERPTVDAVAQELKRQRGA